MDEVSDTPSEHQTPSPDQGPVSIPIPVVGSGPGSIPPQRPAPPPVEPPAARPEPEPKKEGSFLKELPILIIIAFGLALLIKTFLLQAFYIPSESMTPTDRKSVV